jgi:hypothetical protein
VIGRALLKLARQPRWAPTRPTITNSIEEPDGRRGHNGRTTRVGEVTPGHYPENCLGPALAFRGRWAMAMTALGRQYPGKEPYDHAHSSRIECSDQAGAQLGIRRFFDGFPADSATTSPPFGNREPRVEPKIR